MTQERLKEERDNWKWRYNEAAFSEAQEFVAKEQTFKQGSYVTLLDVSGAWKSGQVTLILDPKRGGLGHQTIIRIETIDFRLAHEVYAEHILQIAPCDPIQTRTHMPLMCCAKLAAKNNIEDDAYRRRRTYTAITDPATGARFYAHVRCIDRGIIQGFGCTRCSGVFLGNGSTVKGLAHGKLCHLCYTEFTRPCCVCDERLWMSGSLKVRAAGDGILDRARVTNYACTEHATDETILKCAVCNMYVTPNNYVRDQTRCMWCRPPLPSLCKEEVNTITNSSYLVYQQWPEEVKEESVKHSNALYGARGRRVVQAWNYKPEALFFGKHHGYPALPGFSPEKQPFIQTAPRRPRPGQERIVTVIKDRDFNKRKVHTTLPATLYIGMELEVECKKVHQVNRDAIAAEFLQRVSPKEELCYIKHDGSLAGHGQYGFEIVTHPQTFEHWNEQFPFEEVQRLGGTCKSFKSPNCGNHYHLSKDAFTNLHLYKFTKWHFDNQSFIFFIAERNNQKYSPFRLDDERHMITYAKEKTGNPERRTAINLQNAATVELRYFKGNLRANRLRKNIEFLHALFMFTKFAPIPDLTVAAFLTYVGDNRKMYPNLYEFILNYVEAGE